MSEAMSFFSFLQQAAIEKCHSAALAWLFSDSNQYISESDKLQIISSWTQVNVRGQLRASVAECNGIDILLEYDDAVIAIENKIKISEHSDQLSKYSTMLTEMFPDRKIMKLFLSLLGEAPSRQDWMMLEYDSVLSSLKRVQTKSEIILDYIENLDKLVTIKNEFLSDHTMFPKVFSDGSSSKLAKQKSVGQSKSALYIAQNGLETILQKAFFQRIAESLNFECAHCLITETRGIALIDIKNPCKIPKLTIESEIIDLGIQVQGATIKAQFESGYDESGRRKQQSATARMALDGSIPRLFELLQLKHFGWRLNPPRTTTSAYYSFSKKIEFPPGSQGFADCTFKDALIAVRESTEECIKLFRQVEEHLTSTST